MTRFSDYWQENADRTLFVFCAAGIIFSAGIWAYIFGATTTIKGETQYDALSLLPILFSFSCMFALNTLCDRNVLTDSSIDFFSGTNLRFSRFFVFSLFILSLTSVATAILLGSIKYANMGWSGLATGMILSTFLITIRYFNSYLYSRKQLFYHFLWSSNR